MGISNSPAISYGFVLSSEELACNVPSSVLGSEESGSAQVFLATNGDEFQPTGLSVEYTIPMSISSVTPQRINEEGGYSLLIRGTNFPDLSSLACRFSGGGHSTVPALWSRSTAVRCLVPSLFPGEVVVELTFNGVDYVAAPQLLTIYPKLAVKEIFPLFGPVSGGTAVTITGTGFGIVNEAEEGTDNNSSLACLFGDISAVAAVKSPSSILCQTPAGFENVGVNMFGSVPVTIARRHCDGTVTTIPSAPSPLNYLYFKDMILQNVVPETGPMSGATRVVLPGLRDGIAHVRAAGIEPDVRCRFGSDMNAAIILSKDQEDGEEISCIAPPVLGISPSNVSVTFSLNGGADFVPSEAVFYYFEDPRITSVTPSTVSVKGGSIVVLIGRNFPATGVVKCIVGPESLAVEGTWVSSTTVECVSPPLLPGFTSISATFNGVDISTSTALLEYYDDLRILSVSPGYAAVRSGMEITLRGTGLVNSTLLSVRWRRHSDVNSAVSAWYMTTMEFINETAATFEAPYVVSENGVDSVVLEMGVSNNALDFAPVEKSLWLTIAGRPQVHAAFPRYGSAAGGTVVAVTGTHFVSEGTSCFFRLRNLNTTTGARMNEPFWLTQAEVRNSTYLTCISPEALPGEYFIEVVAGTRSGNSATFVADKNIQVPGPLASVGFTFIPVPGVANVEPTILPESGGIIVTIEGVNLTHTGLEACRFGGEVVVEVTWRSASSVRCSAPPAPPGLVSVEATLNGVDWLTVSGGVLYEPDGFVYSLSPSEGPLNGGSLVLVTGVGFGISRGDQTLGVFFCSFGHLEVSCLTIDKST